MLPDLEFILVSKENSTLLNKHDTRKMFLPSHIYILTHLRIKKLSQIRKDSTNHGHCQNETNHYGKMMTEKLSLKHQNKTNELKL